MILCICPTPNTDDEVCTGCGQPVLCNNCHGSILCDCIPQEEWLDTVLHKTKEKVA